MPGNREIFDESDEDSVLLGEEVSDEEVEPSQSSTGSGNYTVKKGECLVSIAQKKGFFWQTIWNDPGNAGLKDKRKDASVLLKGDRLVIPELREKAVPASSENLHSFVRKGGSCRIKMRFLDADLNPRVKEPYTLQIEGESISGKLDGDGCLNVPIPPTARHGKVKVGDDEEEEMMIGELDPITELSGVQSRLHNLGYACGPIDGIWGPRTKGAVAEFQRENDLDATGALDDNTRRLIKKIHDVD